MDARLDAVLTEIRSLLDVPPDGNRPSRAVAEDKLTSGYAYALALDGERLRIERRLHDLLRSAGEARSSEVSELAGKLAHADRELAEVRALLSELREQTLS